MVFDKIKVLKGKKNIGIILIHGWSANPLQFHILAKMLNEAGYWVFLPLLPGHGTSPTELEEMKWQVWLDDVIKSVDIVKEYNLDQVFLGGLSLGGNLSLLASLERNVDGIILMGTPVHVKSHFWAWIISRIGPYFKKYLNKSYPKNTAVAVPKSHSYSFFPIKSVKESLAAIRVSAIKLNKVKTPVLIIQTSSDYLVTKYSPWVIYNRVKSKNKKLQWIQSKHDSHTLTKGEVKDFFSVIHNFILDFEDKK